MRRGIRHPHGLLRDESGATAVVFGLCMTALMGFAGMAIDVGLWYADRRAVQGAADSAAYSAAIDSFDGDSSTVATSTAQAVAAGYGFTNGSGGVTVTVNNPPKSGSYTTNANGFEVIITKSESLFFSSLFIKSASVSARAVGVAGMVAGNGKYCVEALDTSTGVTVSASNGITVNLTACGMQVNGPGSGALTVIGGANISAATLSVVGNIATNNGGSTTVSGTKTTGAPAIADPYANVATPTAGTCAYNNASYTSGGPITINPGTYCNGLSVSNGVTVNMNPGVYIISGGVFSQQGGTTINATGGVTIVLTGSGTNYATVNIANGAYLNLTAPSTGATAGLAIMQDRNAPTSTGGAVNCTSYCSNAIAGGAAFNVIGALYFPTQFVGWSNGTSNTSKCTQLIAYDIQFTGGTDFSNNCTNTGVLGIGVSNAATALVE
jgi:Flp pilus assembly protein TadG